MAAGRISQTFYGSRLQKLGWSDFKQEHVRMVKLSGGACGIGQIFCRTKRDWSDLWQELEGLVRTGGISQTS